jgi:hypothetical protein
MCSTPKFVLLTLPFWALTTASACSGDPGSGGAGNVGGHSNSGGSTLGVGGSHGGGSTGNGGSTAFPACGTQTCTSNQICVHPSCGGGIAPACIMLNDGGLCPSGWTYSSFCNNLLSSGPGCRPPPCVNPPAFCASIPAGCGNAITCGCLPTNVCSGSGSCGLIQNGTDVVCMSA